MDALLVVLCLLLVSGLTFLLVVRTAVRGIRRRVVVLVDRAQLTARSHGVGRPAELARLRREVQHSTSGLHRALTAARDVGAPVGDVPSLRARLELAARAVDGELRMLEAMPDRAAAARRLPDVRARAETVCESAAALVDGLLQAAQHDAEGLALLRASCEIEAEALRAASTSRVDSGRFDSGRRP
ncbi:MAG TPA: hypothetical protein VFR56_04770 [Actinomycetes bacterium]|nr:hypothetical protein [Actinomycetes bacterium]